MDHHNFFGIVRQDLDPRLRMDRHHHKQECMQPCRQLILMLVRRHLSNMKVSLTHLLLDQFSFLALKLFEQCWDQSHQLNLNQLQQQLQDQTTSTHHLNTHTPCKNHSLGQSSQLNQVD